LNTKKTTTYDVGNPDPGLAQAGTNKATFSIFIGSLCCTVNFVIILFFTGDVFLSQNDDILSMTDPISAH
jgi:hypothetical protein